MNLSARTSRHKMLLTILYLLYCITMVHTIDCFKCVSMNGKFPACDDPFHNNHSLQMLESPCMGGRKGRNGLFPATSCIKLAGTFDDTEETITIRGCGLDSGTATTDTEIIRMSHCGRFYYNESANGLEWLDQNEVEGADDFTENHMDMLVPIVSLETVHDSPWTELEYVHGCLQSCNDADACNKSGELLPYLKIISILPMFVYNMS